MASPLTKEQGVNISLSFVTSLCGVLGVLWLFIRPVLMADISVALAQDIRKNVQREVAPLAAGFVVIIQSNITRLRKDIAQLERVRNADPQGWGEQQANELVDKQRELEAQVMALEALSR